MKPSIDPSWALVPLRMVTGFGFAAHGWAKLSRGPDQFAVILTALGVPEAGLGELAELIAARPGARVNPRPTTAEDVAELLRRVW